MYQSKGFYVPRLTGKGTSSKQEASATLWVIRREASGHHHLLMHIQPTDIVVDYVYHFAYHD